MNENLWHELRAENIGGSEVADLFNKGFNSHYQLWHIKKGNMPRVDLSDNERVMAGNYLESAIMRWANRKWGTNLINPKAYYRHPTIKGSACTPDGIDFDAKIMCQIKNCDSMVFGKMFEADGDNITNAPLKYLLQVQQEMSCVGYDECHLIVLVGGNRLCRMVVYRDDDVVTLIEKSIKQFWDSIAANDAPEPDFALDGPALSHIRQSKPLIDDVPAFDMSNNNRLMDLCASYQNYAAAENDAKKNKKIVSTEIMTIVGQHKKISCGDYNISIVDKPEFEGNEITQEMVGTKYGARAASSYPSISKPKPKKKKD